MAKPKEYILLGIGGVICYGLFSLFSGCVSLFHSDTPQENQAKLSTEMSDHPGYEADMQDLIQHLSASNIAASWPGGYGGSKRADTIYLSMSPSESESDASPLASHVYDKMMLVRQKDGFGDSSGACFVHVLDTASSRELSVDRMGKLE